MLGGGRGGRGRDELGSLGFGVGSGAGMMAEESVGEALRAKAGVGVEAETGSAVGALARCRM